jgi:adenylyltransferase/sulfurtransferase
MRIAAEYDVIIDGTDNFPTRYLSNDVAVWLKKPNVYGSILRFDGQVGVFAPHLAAPCYRCMCPQPPPPGLVPSCAEGGVLGVLPGLIGTMQALEAIKLITGIGQPLLGKLLHLDTLSMRFRTLTLRRDPDCPVCGDQPTITQPIDYEGFCGIPKSPAASPDLPAMTVHELKELRDAAIHLPHPGCHAHPPRRTGKPHRRAAEGQTHPRALQKRRPQRPCREPAARAGLQRRLEHLRRHHRLGAGD